MDDSAQLQELLRALRMISEDVPLYFPVHPRTRDRLRDLELGSRIQLLDPLGHLDFVCLMSHSAVVLTDSGGIQEETTALHVPCLTLRNNTERPITIELGTNRLAGTTYDSILDAWQALQGSPNAGKIPQFWDGKAAERSVEAIRADLLKDAAHRMQISIK